MDSATPPEPSPGCTHSTRSSRRHRRWLPGALDRVLYHVLLPAATQGLRRDLSISPGTTTLTIDPPAGSSSPCPTSPQHWEGNRWSTLGKMVLLQLPFGEHCQNFGSSVTLRVLDSGRTLLLAPTDTQDSRAARLGLAAAPSGELGNPSSCPSRLYKPARCSSPGRPSSCPGQTAGWAPGPDTSW